MHQNLRPMQIIVMLIIISLLVAGGFLVSFFWAVNDGQYEDDYTPALRILIDDDMYVPEPPVKEKTLPTNTLNNNTNDKSRNI